MYLFARLVAVFLRLTCIPTAESRLLDEAYRRGGRAAWLAERERQRRWGR